MRWFILLFFVALFLFFYQDLFLLYQKAVLFLQLEQNLWRRRLLTVLHSLREGGDLRTWWIFCGSAFLYGALHALGPGHGKALMVGFLLTHKSAYQRMVALSFLGAFFQALSAIFWVVLTLGLGQWLMRKSLSEVVWIERMNAVFLWLFAFYLFYLAWRNRKKNCHHAHGHSHEHDGSACCSGHAFLHQDSSASFLATALAMGIRPCGGSLLVLAVAFSGGFFVLGIWMCLAIALGVWVAVSALGFVVLYGKLSAYKGRFAPMMEKIYAWRYVVFGIVLIFLGTLLYWGAGSYEAPFVGGRAHL